MDHFFYPRHPLGQKGFTLIEMAIVMVIIGMVISTMVTVLPTLMRSSKVKETRARLTKYDYALRGYAISNFRLPFADSDQDGVENPNVFIGDLPYLTLGLTQGEDVWGNPVKYAVYGAVGDPNNLTDTTDKTTLCAALAAISGFNNLIAYTTTADTCAAANATNSANQAYVIASGGPRDRDGHNGFFDLCTGTPGPGFNAANKIQATDYDDLVRAFSLGELTYQNCTP